MPFVDGSNEDTIIVESPTPVYKFFKLIKQTNRALRLL